jgi:hypothetical protein
MVCYSKYAENTFIMEEFINPVKLQKQRNTSKPALPEFLEYYLLLYEAYYGYVSIFKSNAVQVASSSTVNCLDLECCHLHT